MPRARRIPVRLNPRLWTRDQVEVGGEVFRHDGTTELSATRWRQLRAHETKQGGVLHQTLVSDEEPAPEPVHIAEPVQAPSEGDESGADEAPGLEENDDTLSY